MRTTNHVVDNFRATLGYAFTWIMSQRLLIHLQGMGLLC